jgi:hypothetical protein
MSLQVGDWVRTDTGQEGKVVLVSESRLTAYVETRGDDGESTIVNYLVSQLTKIAPPSNADSSN